MKNPPYEELYSLIWFREFIENKNEILCYILSEYFSLKESPCRESGTYLRLIIHRLSYIVMNYKRSWILHAFL